MCDYMRCYNTSLITFSIQKQGKKKFILYEVWYYNIKEPKIVTWDININVLGRHFNVTLLLYIILYYLKKYQDFDCIFINMNTISNECTQELLSPM